MREPRYDRETLETVSAMVESEYRGFDLLKKAAYARIEKHQSSLMRLIFRTDEPIDPERVAFDRGFLQGVMFMTDGLPNDITNEFRKTIKESDPSA